MQWTNAEGCCVNGVLVQAPLVYSGPYTISCRADSFTLSFRPEGEHHAVGTFPTLEAAQDAACRHADGALPATKIWPFDDDSVAWRSVVKTRGAEAKRSRQRELELDIEDFGAADAT